MRSTCCLISALALLTALAAPPAWADGPMLGKKAPTFDLRDAGGHSLGLSSLLSASGTKAVVVEFESYAGKYSLAADRKLAKAISEYQKEGIRFVSIFPNVDEDLQGMAGYASRMSLGRPVLKDHGGSIAKAYGVEVTPTFFALDSKGKLLFRGGVDGLLAVLPDVAAGKPVAKAELAAGLPVHWAEKAVPDMPESSPRAGPRPRNAGPATRRRPRGAPRGLSRSAEQWLDRLAKSLGSKDELVRRSAMAGIMAMGKVAVPHLTELRKSAKGESARALDAAIHILSSDRPTAARGQGFEGRPRFGRGGRGDRGGRRFSMIEMEKRRLGRALDLTADQKAKIDKALNALKDKEKAAMDARQSGDRQAMRAAMRDLRQAIQSAIDPILTADQKAKLEQMQQRFRNRRGR